MRLIRRACAYAGLIALCGLACAGCATSTPAGPPQVTLSLTAPTSGATVGVRKVIVTGSVNPVHAAVRVAGKHVRVRHGSFVRPVYLNGRTTRIRIVARARGYRSARIDTTVHYSAGTAKVMLLARRAATSVRALASSGSANPSVLGPTLGSPAGRALFMQGCNNTPGQEQACTCFYDHLARSGAFNSRSKQTAAMNQIIQAASDDNVAEMPFALRSAAAACASVALQVPATGGAPPV